MRFDTLIVYHEPGVKGSERTLEELLRLLENEGFYARLEPLEWSVKNHCWGARIVYLLMMGRGGHWLALRDSCNTEPRIIPAWVVAASVSRLLRSGKAESVLLLYRRARRNVQVYSSDLAGIAHALRVQGFRVLLLEASMAEKLHVKVDAVVPLSLLPGRLPSLAERLAKLYSARLVAPPLAYYALSDIAAWIASDLATHVTV